MKTTTTNTKNCKFTYQELRYLLTSVENQKFKMMDEMNNDKNAPTIKKLRELQDKLSNLYIEDLGAIIEKI
tara:strand:+ start:2740 stop:2952 length:213 start_codon:yes stop_codon:yes gene_type:complete